MDTTPAEQGRRLPRVRVGKELRRKLTARTYEVLTDKERPVVSREGAYDRVVGELMPIGARIAPATFDRQYLLPLCAELGLPIPPPRRYAYFTDVPRLLGPSMREMAQRTAQAAEPEYVGIAAQQPKPVRANVRELVWDATIAAVGAAVGYFIAFSLL